VETSGKQAIIFSTLAEQFLDRMSVDENSRIKAEIAKLEKLKIENQDDDEEVALLEKEIEFLRFKLDGKQLLLFVVVNATFHF
jgi:hypothetical protein